MLRCMYWGRHSLADDLLEDDCFFTGYISSVSSLLDRILEEFILSMRP